MRSDIIFGDCLEIMRTFPDNHFSAVVTDPPYGLSFMNKGWDQAVPSIGYWEECLRIAKPGSFLISMGGTRTFHRLTCAIEDAGWEIRDCISWLYGSGFPKSHNNFGIDGFGTALKPAWEPCIIAMKPLDGTFKQNAEKWGQAGINIKDSRIGKENGSRWPSNAIFDEEAAAMLDEQSGRLKSGQRRGFLGGESINQIYGKRGAKNINPFESNSGGASRFFYCAKASSRERNEGLEGMPIKEKKTLNEYINPSEGRTANKSGANMANHHPTVKPLSLMKYLITLVMPPKDGILLDPFAGSGTTILAAQQLDFDAIGIEKSPEYVEIARARLEHKEITYEDDLISLSMSM